MNDIIDNQVQNTEGRRRREYAPLGASATFTVRYSVESLQRLKLIQDETHIHAREWFRVLLQALLEAYDQRGGIGLPLAVVPRSEAKLLK